MERTPNLNSKIAVFVRYPHKAELLQFIKSYNVEQLDPEKMPLFEGYSTNAHFHLASSKPFFRRETFATQTNPGHAADPVYVEQLIRRTKESPGHLQSFLLLAEFMKEL